MLSFFLTFFVLSAFTQNKDTLVLKPHSPKKATIMSAILPGAGQFYNKSYWKIPVLYAGFGTLGYFISTNQKLYKDYTIAYKARVDNDPKTVDIFPLYSADGLLQAKNYYRRNMELSYIFTAFLYILNVVDATVDANFYDFDINDKLTLQIRPTLLSSPYAFKDFTKGVKISLNFKN